MTAFIYRDQPEVCRDDCALVLSHLYRLGVMPGNLCIWDYFYLETRVFSTRIADHIQTLMYLKLSIAGHLTIFLHRTQGTVWSIRPARGFYGSPLLGTRSCHAVDRRSMGSFMTPLGWGWALFVCGLRTGLVPCPMTRGSYFAFGF